MSAERPTVVGWDLDDCLAPTMPLVASIYKERFDHRIDLARMYTGDPAAWGVTDFAEAVRRYEEIMAMPGFHGLLIPSTDTLLAVHGLHDWDIGQVVITGRADRFRDATSQWLRRQFTGVPLGLITTNHYTSDGGTSVTKGEVCRKEDITHMCDDAPVHLDTLDPTLTAGFLMDQPWNQGIETPGIVRVVSPLEFARACLRSALGRG